RVPFGTVASPFSSATLNHHLKTIGNRTALEIRKNLYVDNVLIAAEGTKEALNKYRKTKVIFKDAAMNIREFTSNDKNFNECIPKEDKISDGPIKLLGITWIPEKDVIKVVQKPWQECEITKRNILRFIASQYDPLGLLTPTMVLFKLFLQHLWKNNVTWDETLNKEDEESWKSLIKGWPSDMIELPRVVVEGVNQMQLHVFTDASSVAYSAMIYAVCANATKGETSIIFSKSRLAPIKGTSIPRLELLAILIGVRAVKFVKEQLEYQDAPIILWSDSRCALHWVWNHSQLLPKCIQNRVEEIRKAK
ncbi:pao retrotransposon peptidase, partial [Wuchereria bancrofti]